MWGIEDAPLSTLVSESFLRKRESIGNDKVSIAGPIGPATAPDETGCLQPEGPGFPLSRKWWL